MFSNAPPLFVAASVALTLLLSLGSPTHAGFVVNVTESGGNVLATGSGTINTTALTFDGPGFVDDFANFQAAQGQAFFGSTGNLTIGYYVGLSGPSSFGPGGSHTATSGTGDFVGVTYPGSFLQLVVPVNYISGSQLSSSDTYSGATFSSLGLTPGTYTYTFGAGANTDSFTMNIGVSSVPEPGSLMMLGTGSLAILGFARRRRRPLA
jgi:hypothetical protein